jgi:hypothetical protein
MAPESAFPTAPSTPTTYPLGATNGVAMNTPPEILLPSITAAVKQAATAIPDDKRGALVGVVCPTGVNLAVVSRLGDDVTVTAWLGKTWQSKNPGASPWSYGAQVVYTF